MWFVKLIFVLFLAKASNGFQCGEVKVANEIGLSVGGTEAKAGQWPWLVALFRIGRPPHNVEKNWNFFCGATLINSKTLLTGENLKNVFVTIFNNLGMITLEKAQHYLPLKVFFQGPSGTI